MAVDDPYESVAAVAKGKLKLKVDSGITKKKKKKDKKLKDQAIKTMENNETEEMPQQKITKTKAELAFLQQQEKMKMKRILEKATMTHKERVEKFNQHLDSLTEHFDIPKVSWTK
ncbi:protein FAM32A-like [Cylas formicarius]|uniref:protein FAM32A-like n=1 Tax=Cylas formicarius TaxID=197179 RepID=UPI0029585BB2|nr:protein FAM32A-like [Cylas formicarius]